jgi:hypothetical protein
MSGCEIFVVPVLLLNSSFIDYLIAFTHGNKNCGFVQREIFGR